MNKLGFRMSETIKLEESNRTMVIKSPIYKGIMENKSQLENAKLRRQKYADDSRYNLGLETVTLLEHFYQAGLIEDTVLKGDNLWSLKKLYAVGKLPADHPFFLLFEMISVFSEYSKKEREAENEIKLALKALGVTWNNFILEAERRDIAQFFAYKQLLAEKSLLIQSIVDKGEQMNMKGSRILLFAHLYHSIIKGQFKETKAKREKQKGELDSYDFTYIKILFLTFPIHGYEFMKKINALSPIKKEGSNCSFAIEAKGAGLDTNQEVLSSLLGGKIELVDGVISGTNLKISLDNVLGSKKVGTAESPFTIGKMVGLLENISVFPSGLIVLTVKGLKNVK